ncbi:MAG: gamma-glutamyltransferase [Zetaproteobacteria bacterium]|nr:MAG: gamma-glutamyltransferase [Zetaproteobacteria bacterium]
MVVAAERLAADAGAEMLRQGGTACDAAAATALALGVVEPASSGIGGGGFFLIRTADGQAWFLDARETSPRRAGRGEPYREHSSIDGPQAAGVPGLLAGVDALLARCGRLDRATIAAPAIRLAEEGFVVNARLARMIRFRRQAFNEAARRTFDKRLGERIVQKALAQTLKRYARFGARDFYRGRTARLLVADLRRAGGWITMQDLAGYQAKWRKPITFRWHGMQVISAPPPSSGGMTLAHMFGQLAHDKPMRLAEDARVHLLVEVMKRAYFDRNRFLGDPDFVPIPRDYLDLARLLRLRRSIDPMRATPAAAIGRIAPPSGQGADTTHLSVLDRDGNIVSATLSINYPFGSAWLSPRTGILLNDEMDDFALGRPNAYGLVQGRANRPAPGKRMLSSMTPTIAIDGDRVFVVGTPGGSRIITMVFLALLRFHAGGNPKDWVAAPRFHHQHLPDRIQYEPQAFDEATKAKLRARGHRLQQVRRYGNMQAILWNRRTGEVLGLSDPRGRGASVRVR